MSAQAPQIEFIEAPILCEIDRFLDEFKYSSIIEGWKVRDLLLDLRNLTAEIVHQ